MCGHGGLRAGPAGVQPDGDAERFVDENREQAMTGISVSGILKTMEIFSHEATKGTKVERMFFTESFVAVVSLCEDCGRQPALG